MLRFVNILKEYERYCSPVRYLTMKTSIDVSASRINIREMRREKEHKNAQFYFT